MLTHTKSKILRPIDGDFVRIRVEVAAYLKALTD